MNQAIGVLFDIDGLGAPSSYGTLCWRILMKHLDLKQMPGVLFYQGDVEVQASQRPYCYCIAISELAALTGGKGSEYLLRRLTDASDAGLFPVGQRFIRGDVTSSLIGSGRVDIEGRFRMSANLGDLGDLRLVTNGREFGWAVLPDDDLLAVFALTYLAKTGREGIPLGDQSTETCESVLREVGQRSTLAALRTAGLPPDRLKAASERIVQQVWKGAPEAQSAVEAEGTPGVPTDWDAAQFMATIDGLMRRAFPHASLSQYDMIQERVNAGVYERTEFSGVLSTCLAVCGDRLPELAAELSKPDYPSTTPFLVYCHDQFDIGRQLKQFDLCRAFGRILGEAICRGKNQPVHVEEQERRYGLNISFLVAQCPRCGMTNRGIPAAADAGTKSISTEPTRQSKRNGVAALCSGCLRWFVAEWD